jgi:protein O-mannosyl-transferase
MTDATQSTEPSRTSWLPRQRNLLTGLLLMLVAWGMYLPSVKYGFVYYDDVRILRNHPELYGQNNLSSDLHAIFVTSFPREEPLLLRDVSWALDSRIFGFGNAFGYHLGNVLLHGIVVALMFAFLLGTTRRYGFALAVSIAWLVLAIHTEPVAWIMGRKDILSTMFMLLALCAQTRRLTAESLHARCGWYFIVLVCFVGGLFSKISVLTFPLVLFLHAVFLPYLNGERPGNGSFLWGRNLLGEVFLTAPGLAISVLVYGWYRQTLTQMGILDRGQATHGLSHVWNLLMVDPPTIWMYVQQAFLPWHPRVFYHWPELLAVYPRWQVAASLASVVMAGGAGVRMFRQHKDLFFYYAAFFVIMVPYLNLVIPGILVAERYLYFSVFCLAALGLSAAAAMLRRPQPMLRGGVLAVGAGIAALNLFQTFSYLPAWRSGETLWQYHLTLPQPGPAAYGNLAAYYYAQATDQQGTPEMAVSMSKMSAVVDAGLAQFWPDRRQSPPPDTSFLFFLQSIIQEIKGEPEAALESLLTADRLRPKFDSTNLNLARLYRKLAGMSADSKQRETYCLAARDRFEEYIALAYRGRAAPPEVQKELADLEAACSVSNQPADNVDKKTAPAK